MPTPGSGSPPGTLETHLNGVFAPTGHWTSEQDSTRVLMSEMMALQIKEMAALVAFCSQHHHLVKRLNRGCNCSSDVTVGHHLQDLLQVPPRFQHTRGLRAFRKFECDGTQLYLAATENQFVDRGTAAWLWGGCIKSLLSPAAGIHSVRWARSSYCGTNVGPAGRNANWSRTKWQVSRRKN